jgi:hypothetical protein
MESRKVYQVTMAAGLVSDCRLRTGLGRGKLLDRSRSWEVARHSGGVERPSGKAACTSAPKLVIAVGAERGWRTLGRLAPSKRVDSDRGPADQ